MGLLAFAVFAYQIRVGSSIEDARNLTLLLMVLFGNIHALSSRSETRSIFSMPFFSNLFLAAAVPFAQFVHIASMYTPGLNDVLQIKPVPFSQWLTLAGVALTLLVVEEIHKWWLRQKLARGKS